MILHPTRTHTKPVEVDRGVTYEAVMPCCGRVGWVARQTRRGTCSDRGRTDGARVRGDDVTSQPKRIQLRRTKGWRKPEGAIVVARPSRWGNPFAITWCVRITCGGAKHWHVLDNCLYLQDHDWAETTLAVVGTKDAAVREAVAFYRLAVRQGSISLDRIGELAGHDLACWCQLDQPCHADVLLELANAGES